MTASHSSINLSRKVNQCIEQQQWHQAKHHCQQLLKFDPQDAQVHQLLGLILVQLAGSAATADSRVNHIQRAVLAFEAATQHDPLMFDAFLNLGNAYLQAQRAKDSLQAFRAALALKPDADLVYANQAEAYRQLGDSSEALSSLGKAVQLAPHKHGYLVKTGNLLRELGNHEQAIACFEAAIHIEPDQAEAYAHMAVSMEALGHHDAALGCCKVALEIDPTQSVALYHRALLEMRSEDTAAAHKSLDATLKLQPRSASAWLNKGLLLVNQKQYTDALSALDRAIDLGIVNADTYQNRAVCHQELDQLDSAISDLEKALDIDPKHALSLMSLGVISQKMGRFEAALQLYTQAIEQDPYRVEAYSNLGAVLFECNRFEDARITLEAAIELNPKQINAWINLGAALMQLYRYDEALAAFDQVLSLEPNHVDALCHKGLVLHDLRQIDTALMCYDRALKIDPDSTLAQWNKAFGLMLKGDFTQGWPQYESRWLHKKLNLSLRHFPQPRWTAGSPVKGKRLFIYQEQGLGDTLMFARFIPTLVEMGALVTLEVQAPLVQLLSRCLPQVQVICMGQPIPEFDLHSPLLSIPGVLGLQEIGIASNAEFLSVSTSKFAEWSRRLGHPTRPRIGLAWSGNPVHQNDRNRSISLSTLLAMLPDGFDYVSLQNQVREDDGRTLGTSHRVRSFADEIKDFEDTAALCRCMDLIISVDTSVAHLSAALGQPTWVMIPYAPDWRWMMHRTDTPWYRSMKLYRQTTPGVWQQTLSTITQDLTSRQFHMSSALAQRPEYAVAA